MKIIKRIAFSLLVFYVVLEVGIWLFLNVKQLPVPQPSFSLASTSLSFYTHTHPKVGDWHIPGGVKRHLSSNFDVTYRANSYGARDVERQLKSDKKRILLLGDSLTEGHGVEDRHRWGNVLEKTLGYECLNFGIAGTGTCQQVEVYRHIASRFDHEAVVLALFPANDFDDNDIEKGKSLYADRYKPYYVGEYPDYQIQYYQDSPDKVKRDRLGKRIGKRINHILREFSYSFCAFSYYRKLRRHQRNEDSKDEGRQSRFHRFTPGDLDKVRFGIEELLKLMQGKKMVLLALPAREDLESASATSPLTEQLASLCRELKVTYIDVGKELSEYPNAADLYIPGDGHMSIKGNELLGQYLAKEMAKHGW